MSLNTFNLYPFYKLELFCFSGYLGYFILGYYLANYAFKFNSKTLIKIGIFSFIIGTVILMFIDFYKINVGESYLNIFNVIQSAGVFLSIRYIDEYSKLKPTSLLGKIQNHINTGNFKIIIYSISICSFSMYFIHIILIKFIKMNTIHSLKLLPFLWISTVLVSWIISIIISKIPYVKEVCGVK